MQAEADVAGAGLLVEEAARGDAADVALLADAGLQGVGVDLDVLVGLLDLDAGRRLGGRGANGDDEERERQDDGNASHGGTPKGRAFNRTPPPRPAAGRRVLRRQQRRPVQGPRHADARVVPKKRPLALRIVEIRHFVPDLGPLARHAEAVREAERDPHLPAVLRRQHHAHPPAERRRRSPQVHRHIEDLPDGHAHQFPLRAADLVVQTAQHTAARAGAVVLHQRPRSRPRRTAPPETSPGRSRARRGRPAARSPPPPVSPSA